MLIVSSILQSLIPIIFISVLITFLVQVSLILQSLIPIIYSSLNIIIFISVLITFLVQVSFKSLTILSSQFHTNERKSL